jgi:hypothetical protein
VDDPKGRSPPRARRLCARGVGCAAPLARAHSRGEAAIPFGARAYDVTAVLTFSAAAARGALARGVCLDELSTKHSIRPDF